MGKSWPLVPLGETLTERREVPSDDSIVIGETPIVAKIGFEDGRIQLRRDGQTKTGMILIRPGDLVVSGINASKGAIAVYGEENSIPIAATIHYGAYMPNKKRIDVSFLWYLLRSRNFRELLFQHVPGGIKTELKAKRLLPVPIPIPSLSEQRRIVARIEALAAKVEEARELKAKKAKDLDYLLICMAQRNDLDEEKKAQKGWRKIRLERVLTFVDDAQPVHADKSYQNLGIYSFGRGLFHKPPIDGALTSAKTLRKVKKGQFIYSRLFAFEGSYGMVTEDFDECFVSNEYPTFDCKPPNIRGEFLSAYFKSPATWEQIATGSKGLGHRRQRVQPEKILGHEIWLPPMKWQNQIAEVQTKMYDINKHQTESNTELEALLPSILDKAFRGNL